MLCYKNSFKHVFLALLFASQTVLSNKAMSQDFSDFRKDNLLEQNIENIAESNSENALDYTIVFDDLIYFIENPIDINKATKEDLQKFIFLSEPQINNLLKHIQTNGALIALEELQAIDGFDASVIQKIYPYIKLDSEDITTPISIKELFENGHNQLIIRQQQKTPWLEGILNRNSTTNPSGQNLGYSGDNNSLYSRYRYNYNNKISLGFTAEKDPGEQFFKGSQNKGFDFYSAHLFINKKGIFKTIALGDYQAQFGQGLTFYSGFGFGKSSYIMNIKKNPAGLKPYISVDENKFMRGMAGTIAVKDFELTPFFSYKNIDANISSSKDTLTNTEEYLNNENDFVTAFEQTGLHRTPAENERRKVLSERIFGAHVAYKKGNLIIGSTFGSSHYGTTLNRNLSYYNLFEFNATKNENLGIDYQFLIGNFNFFGEISRSSNAAIASTNGVLISLDPKLSLVLNYRNYNRSYQALYANAFGENLKPANEKGIYIGITAGPFRKIAFTAYYDRYIFPWLKYLVNGPSQGEDLLFQVNYTPTKNIDMYTRIRMHDKLKNTSQDLDEIDYLVADNQINFRYNVSYEIIPTIKLRNRVELVQHKLGNNLNEYGYLIFQDVIYKTLKNPFSFTARYALFDTDSYKSRIYAYENDVPYSFSIPAYYYRGSRFYFLMKYNFKKGMEVCARYSKSIFNNQKENSPAIASLYQSLKSDLKIQISLKF